MKDVKAALALLPAIKELDWQGLALVLIAARHYATTAPRQSYTAVTAKAAFPKESGAILINLLNETLNGQVATVVDVSARSLTVSVDGVQMRIDQDSAIPVPTGVRVSPR